MKTVVISASPRKDSKTQIAMNFAYERAKETCPDTEFLNLSETLIDYYRGPEISYGDETKRAAQIIMDADVWIIGTPIYNSFFSSALKNLFEYIDYKKTAGKVAGMAIVASGDIGFNNVQTLLTQLLSYFRVIANPTAVYLKAQDLDPNNMNSEYLGRIHKMVDDTLGLASTLGH